MEKIILKKVEQEPKKRRSAVVVKAETYLKIDMLAMETGMTREDLVDLLLNKALEFVEVQ